VHSGVSKFLLPGGAGGSADNEIQVPWGVGVLGHVAVTGETVNIQIACEVSILKHGVKGTKDVESIVTWTSQPHDQEFKNLSALLLHLLRGIKSNFLLLILSPWKKCIYYNYA
jgi:hypothetical protein